ncbi:S-adenosyl-L-methionine-dependent methyltransferase [Clohesyomyces aquaticus]|uniref:S-adenosyl-L-methionine-dependent methyltransferase n=1 Tax=Clohesyomyces aquaticus TaxID=1231657 RepID=A0A1Y2A4Y6_9PLEO|nr:S-adenosyl-L-methionine-dependent methyltransferase [Clohesyomyces aquaticus]
MAASGSQAESAIRFYGARGPTYDDSWHPFFVKRFISYVGLSPGQQVLDLACGTGLVSFLAADAVGPTGSVLGIDVTRGMLAQAIARQKRDGEKYAHVQFLEGDVLNLEVIEALKGRTFDVITLASALVLFPDPKATVRSWTKYLKPGGRIALDSTHPRNLVSGMAFEAMGRKVGISIPYYRSWSQSEDDLRAVLEAAGLEVEQILTIDDQSGYGRRYYELSDADDQFVSKALAGDMITKFITPEIRRKAQAAFKEEWGKMAVDGRVEEVDTVFLGIARKPTDGPKADRPKSDGPKSEAVFSGGCRCQGVRYQCIALPSGITYCHCRACQQLSGGPYIPFAEVASKSFKYTSSASLKTLRLSNIAERTFCSSCGTPIAMVYDREREGWTSVTMGSIDAESFTCELPKIRRHIFTKEKAPWFELPDDGALRQDTM